MKKWTRVLLVVFAVIGVLVLGFGSSCAERQYMKYASETREFASFRMIARLMGTYHRHEKVNVGAPYRLFIAVTPKQSGDFTTVNIGLMDSNGKSILNEATPEVAKEQSSRGLGYFYYFEVERLDISYEEYTLTFDVRRNGRIQEHIELIFKKDYSERRVSKWWEDASSI